MLDNFINHVTNLNATLVAVIMMLVAVGAYLIHIFLDSRFLTALSTLVFTFGAFATHYFAASMNIHLSNDPDTNLLLLTTVGMVSGLVAMVVASRLYGVATDNSKVKVRG